MPLVDPITMASAVSKKGASSQTATIEPSTSPTAETYNLLPVSINQTPLAQTLRHAQPLLLSGVLALGFSSLVKDPVAAMSSTTLPLTAALQAAYAVICLPVAGRGSSAPTKKAKPRPGEKPTKKKAGEGGNNAYVLAVLSLLITALVTPFIYVAMILFGAPLLTHGSHTLLCAAHLSLLGLFPLFYVHGVDASAWAAVGGFRAPLDETFGGLVGALVGAWLGAVPIPLDWDREWQRWPLPLQPVPSTTTSPPKQTEAKHYKGFVAGVFSGIAKLAVGHPFDTLKVRLQTSPPTRFTGPLALGWMFMDSVMLGSLTFYRRLIHDNFFPGYHNPSDPHLPPNTIRLPTYAHGLAGILSGATVSFVAAPVEHIKARLQIQYSSHKSSRFYSGPVDALHKIYKHHGIRGIYHGLGATLIFRGCFFFWWGSYDVFSRWMRNHTSWSAPVINFWAGGLSAQVFWVMSYPSDVVKQRIMTDPLGGGLNDGQPRFKRWKDAARAVYRENGPRGYWRGFLPCFLRAFPANAMALVAFEGVMRALPE
ncbi:putative mitochondrial carrier protein [Apiosordaria backusii]|uniref:Mitochondrial carrier protein n=1 Tax=Apiosordaria backusii TaxID=314023 RepID=A0AA40BJY2_9PEZI|nr:putative mitochondrial carrier protein [Apiosordaria backusii]